MQQSWYGGRKSGGQEAEFQERIQKEWACLHSGGSFLGFWFHCQSIFKVAGPTWKIQSSSKLLQVQKWKAEFPDTPLGLTGIGILEYRWLLHINQFAKKVLLMQYMTYVMTQNMESRNQMACCKWLSGTPTAIFSPLSPQQSAVLENLKFLLEPLKLFLSRITQRASIPYNSNGDALVCLQCHDGFWIAKFRLRLGNYEDMANHSHPTVLNSVPDLAWPL